MQRNKSEYDEVLSCPKCKKENRLNALEGDPKKPTILFCRFHGEIRSFIMHIIKTDKLFHFIKFNLSFKPEYFLFLFQRLILKFECFVLKCENLLLRLIKLYLKFSIVLFKNYYRVLFGFRQFYFFAFHGVLLMDDLDFLYDTQHHDNRR